MPNLRSLLSGLAVLSALLLHGHAYAADSAAALLPATEQAAIPDQASAQRLEALRNALIDRAMQTRTSVKSVAWVDESGRLRESTHITSDLKVRGVRIEAYRDKDNHQQENFVIDAANSVITNGNCTKSGSRIMRNAIISTDYRAADGRGSQYQMAEIGQLAEASFSAQAALKAAWSLQGATGLSNYDQAVRIGARVSAPYSIQLFIETAEAAANTPLHENSILKFFAASAEAATGIHLTLKIQVIENSSKKSIWNAASALSVPGSEGSIMKRRIPQKTAADVERIVADWIEQLETALKCEPVFFDVMNPVPGTLEINAGTATGIRANDKILVFDQTLFPRHLLETGLIEAVYLAEVESVSKYSSRLRFLSAPPTQTSGRWVALPI